MVRNRSLPPGTVIPTARRRGERSSISGLSRRGATATISGSPSEAPRVGAARSPAAPGISSPTIAAAHAHTVDRVGLRLAQNDHGHIAVPRATLFERGAVAEQNEVGTRLTVHDLKAVARQMAFEKAARVRFRLGEEE